MTTHEQPAAREPTEAERVRARVELRFLDLGFDALEAQALAEHGVDWHDAKRLLDAGCDLKTAVAILL